MYVHRRSEPGLWTVGYYTPSGDWVAVEDFTSERKARNLVHYLNGGNCDCVRRTT